MKKILQMLQLQQELNDNTNGIGWEGGVTKNGKLIDWRRCAYLECAELIDSYPWKHWKSIDAEPNYDNIKIEAVDIWHFVMSEAIMVYSTNDLGTHEALATMIAELENFEEFKKPFKPSSKDHYGQIALIEEFIRTIMQESTLSKLFADYFDVAMQSGLDLDTLYQLYIGKNTLNSFRQDHGYKEGSYIKMWNGKEDNEVMQQILESNPQITPQELYNELEKNYPGA